MKMTVGSNTLYFAYEASGRPLAVIYNGTRYHYVTNLQGDVVQIRQGTTPVVNYTYDAWGKLLTTTGSMASTLGTHNPLRYRGYVYDTETQLYYLQSRYYNPALGRFLNADAFTSTGQGFVGNNMFAYCLNNPINNRDDVGESCAPATKEDRIIIEGGVGGVIPIPIPIDVDIFGIIDRLYEALSKSFAHAGKREYRSQREDHHLVARGSKNAKEAVAILYEVFPNEGPEHPLNIISIKTGLHRRIHTKTYYGFVNSIIIGAYYSSEDEYVRK